MNNADFNTQPNGFPLEADATLGFMQNDYQSALRALAKSMAGDLDAIIVGCENIDGIVSDGWIWYDNDLVFFQGGAIAEKFIIQETVTAKANQNGDVVDRYTVKKALFGTGANDEFFSSLFRISSNRELTNAIRKVAYAEQGGDTDWVVLSGMNYAGNTMLGGVAMYGNQILLVAPYVGAPVTVTNPLYLTKEGQWTTVADSAHLKFEPRTSKRLNTVNAKYSVQLGELRWILATELDISQFDNGIGKWDFDGWMIANGDNGTINLQNAVDGVVALQRRD